MSKAHTSAVGGTAKLQGLTAESCTAEELVFLQIRAMTKRGGHHTQPRRLAIYMRIPKTSGKLLLHFLGG